MTPTPPPSNPNPYRSAAALLAAWKAGEYLTERQLVRAKRYARLLGDHGIVAAIRRELDRRDEPEAA